MQLKPSPNPQSTQVSEIPFVIDSCASHKPQRASSPFSIEPGHGVIVIGQTFMQSLHHLQNSGRLSNGKAT